MRPAVLLAILPLLTAARTVPRAHPNDNLAAGGTLRHGELTLRLDARLADWRPDGDSAPGVVVPAFAERGGAPSIPGPLVRVPAGTRVVVTLRNVLPDDTLAVYGLHDRATTPIAAAALKPLRLAPGEERTVRFRLEAPGTYYYYGTTTGRDVTWRTGLDAQLSGAIVVDGPGTRPSRDDRVFVLGLWTDTVGRAPVRRNRILAVINGRSWPHTERLAYAVGDTVTWRIVNATGDSHPMHLHGFYFMVDSRGDGHGDTTFAPADRERANTRDMFPGTTMRITWSPERPGNWLFHCHLPDHFIARGPLGVPPDEARMAAHAMDAHHAERGMAGLVLGVTVRPRPGTAAAPSVAEGPARALRLVVRPLPPDPRGATRFGFTLAGEGVRPSLPDDSTAPPIVLTRGQPARITVVNTLAVPTAVHWHGIELESYYDGVAGFSGAGTRLAPLIAPGDSFVARFTPPRAGTFIYHTHVDEGRQQLAGLAGPIVVLEPGTAWDPATDLTVMVTSPRDWDEEMRGVLLNGSLAPAPLRLTTGVSYRLRFVNMTLRRPGIRLELRRDSTLMAWTPLAKDGAALPDRQRRPVPAVRPISIGETADIELTPDRDGPMRLEVRTPTNAIVGTLPIVVSPVLVGRP